MMIGFSQATVMKLSTHSMKRTMLHWIAVSMMFTMDERRILGHHFDRNLQSPLTYSSEEMAILQAKVQTMLRAIRNGDLDPNRRAVELLAARAEGRSDFEEYELTSGDSIDETNDLETHESLPMPPGDLHRPSVPKELQLRSHRHVLSGIVHVAAEHGNVLECGRKLTHNFCKTADLGEDDFKHSLCTQCAIKLKLST